MRLYEDFLYYLCNSLVNLKLFLKSLFFKNYLNLDSSVALNKTHPLTLLLFGTINSFSFSKFLLGFLSLAIQQGLADILTLQRIFFFNIHLKIYFTAKGVFLKLSDITYLYAFRPERTFLFPTQVEEIQFAFTHRTEWPILEGTLLYLVHLSSTSSSTD